MTGGSSQDEQKKYTIHGAVFRHKPWPDALTSLLHRVLPISLQHSIRDRALRQICDAGVLPTAGVAAVLRPGLALRFLSVSRQTSTHRYGAHPRQVIDVLRADAFTTQTSDARAKLVFFIHGGAWGSGSTWMYRLVADRLSQLGYTVASLGYRVYPDADIHGQVEDVAAAMRWLAENMGALGFDVTPKVYIMGHSSGAHIALLCLIRLAMNHAREDGAVVPAEEGVEMEDDVTPAQLETGGHQLPRLEIEGFIGLSGVYDIHQHYHYESWRGVHEISPMKAAHGGMLHTLLHFSHPLLLGAKSRHTGHLSTFPQKNQAPPPLRDALAPTVASADSEIVGQPATAVLYEPDGEEHRDQGSGDGGGMNRLLGRFLPCCLVVHGMSDSTVPFSQTSTVAAALKALGVLTVVRYLPGGNHFDTVGQLMFQKESATEEAIVRFTSGEAPESDEGYSEVSRSQPHPRPRL